MYRCVFFGDYKDLRNSALALEKQWRQLVSSTFDISKLSEKAPRDNGGKRAENKRDAPFEVHVGCVCLWCAVGTSNPPLTRHYCFPVFSLIGGGHAAAKVYQGKISRSSGDYKETTDSRKRCFLQGSWPLLANKCQLSEFTLFAIPNTLLSLSSGVLANHTCSSFCHTNRYPGASFHSTILAFSG